MRTKIMYGPLVAVALTFSLAACGDNSESADAAAESAAPEVAAPTVAVPEMKPTGDLAPSFGTAPVGDTPAPPTGSAVPEMTPTGTMKQAVDPNQPAQPAAAPPAK